MIYLSKSGNGKSYFHHSLVQHTGFPAAKGVHFYLVLLPVTTKE